MLEKTGRSVLYLYSFKLSFSSETTVLNLRGPLNYTFNKVYSLG